MHDHNDVKESHKSCDFREPHSAKMTKWIEYKDSHDMFFTHECPNLSTVGSFLANRSWLVWRKERSPSSHTCLWRWALHPWTRSSEVLSACEDVVLAEMLILSDQSGDRGIQNPSCLTWSTFIFMMMMSGSRGAKKAMHSRSGSHKRYSLR